MGNRLANCFDPKDEDLVKELNEQTEKKAKETPITYNSTINETPDHLSNQPIEKPNVPKKQNLLSGEALQNLEKKVTNPAQKGLTYTGHFIDDKPEGEGTFYFPNGDHFKGK